MKTVYVVIISEMAAMHANEVDAEVFAEHDAAVFRVPHLRIISGGFCSRVIYPCSRTVFQKIMIIQIP